MELPELPADVLFAICAQLWHDQDYDTLFHCTLASKAFAQAAVPHLYRYVLSSFH